MRTVALLLGGLAVAALAAGRAPGPDPARAVADGCGRSSEDDRLKLRSPQWVYVNDADTSADGPPPSPRWAHGTVSSGAESHLAAHPAVNDLPTAHLSYDFVFNLRPDPSSAFLLAGDPGARTGNYEGREDKTARLHLEWEEGALPPFAWPSRADRVSALGSWVWDCDHWVPGGERTELHPLRAIWVRRNPGGASPRSPFGETEADLFVSTDKTPAGAQPDCAHRVRKDPARFQECLRSDAGWQDVTGSYRFFLPVPARPSPRARLRVRVVDAGSTPNAPPLRLLPSAKRWFRDELERVDRSIQTDARAKPARPDGRRRRVGALDGVTFALDVIPPLAPGLQRLVVAKRIFVGWHPPPSGRVHLRVSIDRLLVRRAMDPGCPASDPNCPARNQSTRLGTVSGRPGEWNVYWNVGGVWGTWAPRLLRTRDGRVYRGRRTVDLYLPRSKSWRLIVFARECDLGLLGNARGTRFPLAPCPQNAEVGRNDDPGVVVADHRSAAASVGVHNADARLRGSTCPPVNRRGCYRLTYHVRVVP